jgi:hypothetical protein
MNPNKYLFYCCPFFLLSFANTNAGTKEYPKTTVWIATVVNIDWPKSGTDPIEKQKRIILKF